MSHLRPQVFFFFFMVLGDEVEYESLELSCQDKVHNSVLDPDLEIRRGRGHSYIHTYIHVFYLEFYTINSMPTISK